MIMKKKKENYLEKVPILNPNVDWETDDQGKICLFIENTGFFNRIAQKLFSKPKTSKIHLDDLGSFVWKMIDGKRDIIELSVLVEKEFGDASHPLYERLVKFFQILENYNFVILHSAS